MEALVLGGRLVRAEGARRDQAMREAMERALTPLEIDLQLLAAKVLDKLADGWSVCIIPRGSLSPLRGFAAAPGSHTDRFKE